MNKEIKENLSEMLFNRDERLLDYITNLQQENERLKHQLNQEKPNYLQIWQLEDRIDKAIECIKQQNVYYGFCDNLLNILQNGSEKDG